MEIKCNKLSEEKKLQIKVENKLQQLGAKKIKVYRGDSDTPDFKFSYKGKIYYVDLQ